MFLKVNVPSLILSSARTWEASKYVIKWLLFPGSFYPKLHLPSIQSFLNLVGKCRIPWSRTPQWQKWTRNLYKSGAPAVIYRWYTILSPFAYLNVTNTKSNVKACNIYEFFTFLHICNATAIVQQKLHFMMTHLSRLHVTQEICWLFRIRVSSYL